MTADNTSDGQDVAVQRTAQVKGLMERLQKRSPIYGMMLSNIQLTSVVRGTVVTTLVLEPHHLNSKNGLHGAVSAVIVDYTTGLAITSWDLREATGATVDMHISYLSTAKEGDTLEIETKAERVGGNLAFVTVRASKVCEDGSRKLVTQGQHTKFVRGTEGSTVESVGK